MKVSLQSRLLRPAFTLVEMTVVILVLLALTSIGFVSSKKMSAWKAGRLASETLRSVYTAQRLFLADNPTTAISSLNPALIGPYMPNNTGVVPTVQSLSNTTLTILVDRSPPEINAGSGTRYDPSGSFTDSLWDVGE
ncbi:MAG: type II secretion system protein [Luteolibacter sp.]